MCFVFQLITFIHTVLSNKKKTKVNTCMVVAPLNTILNWQYEFEMWQEFTKKEIDVRNQSNEINCRKKSIIKKKFLIPPPFLEKEDGAYCYMTADLFYRSFIAFLFTFIWHQVILHILSNSAGLIY